MTRSTPGPAPASRDLLPSPKERRRLREARALSEEQIAAALGVTPATVRAWEKGRTSPRGRRRVAYARLIGSAEAPAAVRDEPPTEVEVPGGTTSSRTEASGSITPPPTEGEAPGSTTTSPTEPGTGIGTGTGPSTRQAVSAGATGPPESGGRAAPDVPPDVRTPAPPTAEEAFDALYTRTAPGLARQTYVLTGRRALSREAVEHAFQLAWQRWPEVARDRDPAGWVRAAAYEYATSPWHRLRRAHRRPDALPEDPGRRALLEALLAMPPAHRRTLLLYDGVGLDLPETAAETEASTPAAANRLMRARAAVTERLPELAGRSSPGAQSALLHQRLGALALGEHVPAPPSARTVRTGGERKAELWTRAAVCFGVLLVGATSFTLHTAPTRYEQPIAPAERVAGVPVLSGPQRLAPQDLKLQEKLRGELVHGPERLVPGIP
ncbi:sigma factor-like helix-turn-helix DNA-binding protein [Streptomyces sp. B1I3]|uniref:sigma factor-like helix-turn-helix DNA-binding protein n=1 Tax=Streptomyces sp. B1I3 TaxID=3042264 RepID=UPI00277D7AD5|nr:sigma factor-like helix-turn-helix DNA-binding protein [Streptomyces sp. B1I3]MDQ0794446.1 DNA-directed RNA polymerase specialized sigma24 family protein [Streptomyces sp. B1I3]